MGNTHRHCDAPRSMRAAFPARRRDIGFSLIETIAGITIIATLGSVTSAIVLRVAESFRVTATGAQLHGELTSAMDRIERELRVIPARPGAAAPNVASVASASISWTDSIGSASLSISGGLLSMATAGEAAEVILSDVTGITIQAYDQDGTALGASLSGAGCDPIRRISVSITVGRNGITDTLRTRVFVRSMMEGGS